ncbi:MAG: hypothetical protein AAF291_12240 [Pseudomonadota bacterium]
MTSTNRISAASKALLWAAIIIAAALFAVGLDLSREASFALTSGLSGAAWLSIQSSHKRARPCFRGCLL